MAERRRVANKQEKRIAKSLNQLAKEGQARQQMASGSIPFAKSDVISENFRIEAKTRLKPQKSMVIYKEWFTKIQSEAIQNDRIPVIAISFGDRVDYMCLRDRDFYSMVEKSHEMEEELKLLREQVRLYENGEIPPDTVSRY